MDRAFLERHLDLAERHVVRGEDQVKRQRGILAKLRNTGADTTEAEKLLANIEQTHRMQVADRDRLRRELRLSRG